MLALISPAKTLDYERAPPPVEATTPRFAEQTARLAAGAAKLSPRRLSALMDISDKLAALNAARYRDFAVAPERPALFAFAGDVYMGMAARTLDAPAIAYAQDHLRILSGLYGLLRPLDSIRPHRLEMGTRWAPGRPATLYRYWGDRVSRLLADDLAAEGSGVIVNLASHEYWRVIAQAPPRAARILTIDFRESHAGGPRVVSFSAKRARGMMARWICEHRIDAPDDLRGFERDGYRWTADGSDDAVWRFMR